MPEHHLVRHHPYQYAPITDYYFDEGEEELIAHTHQSDKELRDMIEVVKHIKDQKPDWNKTGLVTKIPLMFYTQWWQEWRRFAHQDYSWEDYQMKKMAEPEMEPWRVYKEMPPNPAGTGNNWEPAPAKINPAGKTAAVVDADAGVVMSHEKYAKRTKFKGG